VTTTQLLRKIILRVSRFKLLVLVGALIIAATLYFYAKTIPPIYSTVATVYPLTGANESPTSSAISTLLGGNDAPKSFSQEASINIVELAQSRNTREAVVMHRLPGFNNKTIAELLIENYNESKKSYHPAIALPKTETLLAAEGGELLKDNYTAKILKSGILEISFSSSNSDLLSPISYTLIDKISQFYIDLKIKKAKRDYDFTVKKVDSLQAILDVYDRQAVRLNNTTMFVPNSRIEYTIPKENLVNAKERIIRLRDASANNKEESLWRLQKATPIIATLDKPEPPFKKQRPSAMMYAIVGFIIGTIGAIGILISPILYNYIKAEANAAIFGDDEIEHQIPPANDNNVVTTTASV
jgi:capsular polysaccharide biosynthesis protein